VIEMQNWPVFPTMKFGTVHGFFKKAESVREKLPVIDHELNAIFAGCYTTQSRIKRANRKTELALLDAEKLAALDSMTAGASSPARTIERSWRNVLFTHFHDILTGSCVQESREHAMGLFAESLAHAQTIEAAAATRISENTDTSMFEKDPDIRFTQSEGAGVGFGLSNHAGVPNPERGAGKTRVYTVFNTASRAKKELVELTVWDYVGDLRRLEAVDSGMNPLSFQLLDKEPQRYWDHQYVRVLVEVEVAALGYATVALREKTVEDYPTYYLSAERTEQPKGDIVLENEFLKAVIDGRTGEMTSLIEKATGAEQLSAPAGLCVVDSERNNMSAWTIGRYLGVNPVTRATRVTPLKGNLRPGVETEHAMLNSTVKTTITLDAGAKAVKYAFTVDWHESAAKSTTLPVLVYRMPLANKATEVMMDVPGGSVTRTARAMDLPALTYAAALGEENVAPAGNVPFLATDCKYGFRLDRGELIATLINTASGPDPYPERGIHAIEVYAGVMKPCPMALRMTVESLLRPMFGIPVASHKGTLPADGALIGFESRRTVLSSLAMKEDGSFALRAFETVGKGDTVRDKLPRAVEKAHLTDLEGNEIGKAAVEGDAVSFEIGPHRIVELNLTLKG
jgi:alpha-mannosidase